MGGFIEPSKASSAPQGPSFFTPTRVQRIQVKTSRSKPADRIARSKRMPNAVQVKAVPLFEVKTAQVLPLFKTSLTCCTYHSSMAKTSPFASTRRQKENAPFPSLGMLSTCMLNSLGIVSCKPRAAINMTLSRISKFLRVPWRLAIS